MNFFATNGKRPVRLSEGTRRFADDSLNYRYGRDTSRIFSVSLEEIEGFSLLSPLEKYDVAIENIVKHAPLRICEGELLSGAATLGGGIGHRVPAHFEGETIYDAVSHLTLDFETVLKFGIDYIEKKALEAYARYKGTEREPFSKSCLNCLSYMRIWHGRYLEALSDMPEYRDNYNNLKRVPFAPAESFYEAVQSLWFTFAFVRLCGNWPGIGRIDVLLGDYLERDLESGAITLDRAREILAHFFIKGCEWICGGDYGSGDAQHYQNILLSGIGEDGRDVTNAVTYLVLDILEELPISDFPTTVRVNKNTDERLLLRVAEVIRLGGGVIAVYNEEPIINSLVEYGYSLTDARKFANDGCWEVQIPGKTFFTYIPFDSLLVLQRDTLKGYCGDAVFEDFDSLYEHFIRDLEKEVTGRVEWFNGYLLKDRKETDGRWVWKDNIPCTVVSLFEEGCIERGLSYREGGPLFNVISPHIGGLPDVVNSLYAIKKAVFDDKRVSFPDFMAILKGNWDGSEVLRQYVLNKYDYFGNDNDEADLIAKNIIGDFCDICDEVSKRVGFFAPAGVSTFGRQLEWAPSRLATPYGKRAGEILAPNFSPTPGTDKEGATAIIKSYCKAEPCRCVSGAALDVKLLPSCVNGENGILAIVSLIKGFVSLGGHFMQLDVADLELLKRAQENPEDYRNLSVRVSGWNARFITLNREWQDMIIGQTGSEI